MGKFTEWLLRLLTILVMYRVNMAEVNVTECGSRNNYDSQETVRNNGIHISVEHFSLHPQIDVIPGVIYQVVISVDNMTTADFVRLEITDDSGSDHNLTIQCDNLTNPIRAAWRPVVIKNNCLLISATVLSINVTFQKSISLCKTKACRKYISASYKQKLIGSPNFPNKYPDDYNCTYVIYSHLSGPVYLQFQQFDLENAYENKCFDYVKIKKENDWTNPYCGTRAVTDMNFVSTNGIMELLFVTDTKIVRHGFQALVYMIPDCSYTMTDVNGTIRSPNYPSKYYPKMHCSVQLILPNEYRIQAKIRVLELENISVGEDCLKSDYLEFFSQKEDKNISNFQVFCKNKRNYDGTQLVYESSSSVVYVNFHTNSLNEGRGFLITYNGYMSCANESFTSETGSVFSPGFPGKYRNNQDCFYSINVTTGELRNKLQITFNDFSSESANDTFLEGHSCDLDFIEIYREKTVHRICGKWRGEKQSLVFYSNSNFLLLRFVSNNQNTRTGFYASWKTIAEIPKLEPNPILIDNGRYWFRVIWKQRTWSESQAACMRIGGFLAKIPDYKVQKRLERRLLESLDITSDLAFWIGGNDIRFENDFYWTDGTKMQFSYWFPGWPKFNFANKQPSDDGYSSEDCVEIRRQFHFPTKGSGLVNSYYWNDRNCHTRNPFICQLFKNGVTAPTTAPPVTCSRNISLLYMNKVVITSPSFPANYPNFVDCIYNVTTQHPADRIEITFEAFDIEPSIGCVFDNFSFSADFELTKQSIKCGNWSAKEKLLRWISPTNKAFFRFRSDNSVTQSGFKAIISVVTDTNCRSDKDDFEKYLRTWSDNTGCYLLFVDALPKKEAEDACARHNSTFITVSNVTENSILPVVLTSFDVNMTWFAGEMMSDDMECPVLELSNGCHSTTIRCSTAIPFICRKTFITDGLEDDVNMFISTSGKMNIPNNSSNCYGNNEHKIYHIFSPSNTRIYINIVDLDLEYQDTCLYDYIHIKELSNDNITLCGNSSDHGNYFLSENNSITVEFYSDFSVTGRGLTLSWQLIGVNQCILYNSSFIWSLDYQFPFHKKLACCETIPGPNDTRIQLNVLYASLVYNSIAMVTLTDGNSSILIPKTWKSDKISYMTQTNTLTVCLKAERSIGYRGFIAEYQFLTTRFLQINQTIFINPRVHKTGVFQSYNYPSQAPLNHQQNVYLYTEYGYNIIINITNFLIPRTLCKKAFLEISEGNFDLQNEHFRILNKTECTAQKPQGFVTKSYLNSLSIRFRVEVKLPTGHAMLYRAEYTIVQDDDYLTKTKYTHGGILNYCRNQTCLNGGICRNKSHRLSSCQCQPSFTGLFCQTNWCDLDLCNHGTCNNTSSCTCKKGYWGTHCNLTLEECGLTYCSGHGDCIGDNSTSPFCICRRGRQGTSCSEYEVTGTLEQSKLLKEPIWIGLIVILNLVFAFASLFIMRRRCEKNLYCGDPKSVDMYLDKSPATNSPNAASPSIIDTHKEFIFPKEKQLVTRTQDKGKVHQTVRRTNGRESPNLCEENQLAAARLFDSLKSECNKDSDADSCMRGMVVGGTLNFCSIPDSQDEASDMDKDENKKYKTAVGNYYREENSNVRDSSLHCYPDIVIINSTPSPNYEDACSVLTENISPVDVGNTVAHFDNLNAASKRKLFALKAKSANSSFNVDKIYENKYGNRCEGCCTSDCQAVRHLVMQKCHSDECHLSFDSYPIQDNLLKRRYDSLKLQGIEDNRFDSLHFQRQVKTSNTLRKTENRRIKLKSRQRHHVYGADSESLSTNQTYSSECDVISSRMEHDASSKRRRRKSKKQRERSRHLSANIYRSIDSGMDVLKTTVRKSRSNDLNTNIYRNYSAVNTTNDNQVLQAEHLQLQAQRRHSFHTSTNTATCTFNPDDMLNEEQTLSYKVRKSHFIPSLVSQNYFDSITSDVSTEVPSSAGFSQKNLTVPFVSDTDTGFSSTKSLFSLPLKDKDEMGSSVNSSNRRRKDSAYQSDQTSVEVSNVDVVAAVQRESVSMNHTDTSFSQKDTKTYKRLEQAARKLRMMTSDEATRADDIEINDDINTSENVSPVRKRGNMWGSEFPLPLALTG